MRQNSVHLSLRQKECQVGKNRNPKDLSIYFKYHFFPLA